MSELTRRTFIRRASTGAALLGIPPALEGCAPSDAGGVDMGEGFTPPSADELERIVGHMGFEMSAQEVESYQSVLATFLQGSEALDAEAVLPEVRYPERSSSFPVPDENPLGAWYVRTEMEGASDGPLAGRTVAIKDNVMIADVPMMNGTSVLEGYVPDVDATIVERILDAGGRITGKSVCEAYCLSGGSHTSDTGPVHNPHRRGYSAGGSSSGSAALVASGAVDLAIGCDQGGSIRIPSAACGVYGMKPTHGLVPYTGILGFYPAIDHTGPMTASVEDNALFLEVLAGPDGIDPRQGGARVQPYREALARGVSGLRIGILEEGFGHPDLSEPEVDDRVRAAGERLGALGAEVEPVSIPLHRPRLHTLGRLTAVAANLFTMDGYGIGSNGLHVPGFLDAQARWRDRMDDLPPTVKLLLMFHEVQRSRHGYRLYALGANRVNRLRAAYDRALASVDLLLMPTVPFKPRPLPGEDATPAELIADAFDPVANTSVFNHSQHPAMSVPCGMVDGLPVGMMLVGRHWEEPTIYAAAAAFERDVDWRTLQ